MFMNFLIVLRLFHNAVYAGELNGMNGCSI